MCDKKGTNRKPWSPKLWMAGKTFVYWKRKWNMYNKNIFFYDHIKTLGMVTDITNFHHTSTDPKLINQTRA
jgi:hypothetical protein